MNKLKIISTIILLTSLSACEPPVTFTEPQPPDIEILSKFPKRLRGEYVSLADNSTLTINHIQIQRTYEYDSLIHPNQLDSTSRLSGDTIFDTQTNETQIIMRTGDSIAIHVHTTNTIFLLDYDNVIKKFKGYYFLNTRYDKSSWEVKKIQISKGQLTISNLTSKSDIENLQEITETTSDTVPPHQFTPTKKQFKEFIKNDGFSDNETFVRVK